MSKSRVILGVSGASGADLALSIAQQVADLGAELELVVSPAAMRTLKIECGADALDVMRDLATTCYDVADVGARIASGSAPVSGMIVAPCSMRSLAAIANGLDDNLLTRAASVQLKERRRLVLLARETPLTLVHLRNMATVTEMGGIIMPPVPAFYLRPKTVSDIVDQLAARAIDLLRIAKPIAAAWSNN
ncbi:UbiX family flavin prenyltransferase [Cognatishimia sp. WU-CL00825]|uniref:UbiX family flavin prenyltransferase n=1 Tax=Cognatishimia sp. WU-CL00825 TaxID=3127658 RepID=UPI00310AF19C